MKKTTQIAAQPALNIGQLSFEYIGELKWYEGALISLFQEINTKEPYILNWTEESEGFNRWLFFSVTPSLLKQYLEQQSTLSELFETATPPDAWLLAMNGDFVVQTEKKVLKLNLPAAYRPSLISFFNPALCDDLEEIEAFLRVVSKMI